HGGRSERRGQRSGARVIPMDDDAWRRGLARLGDRAVGSITALQEDGERFFVQAVLEKSGARVRVATVAWPKKPFDAWWAEASAALAASPVSLATLETALPPLAPNACTTDTWAAVQTIGAPSARESFSSVWTGTEMILWGGYNGTTN